MSILTSAENDLPHTTTQIHLRYFPDYKQHFFL